MIQPTLPTCPACRVGHLHPAECVRKFSPHGKTVEVPLLTSRCDQCGVETTRAAQQKENLVRLAARKAHYGSLLLGEDILALRKRYGLTQQDASKIFGKGIIAFSRYENEVTYPDDSTTLLLKLAIETPLVMKSLADKANIALPLWAERCEDEQRVKVLSLLKYQDRYMASGSPAKLVGSIASAWTAPVTAIRQTLTLPATSHHPRNESHMAERAFAS